MEYVYSAMVLHSAQQPITEENITKVLAAAGVTVDDARVKALTAALEGVDIEEALKTAVAAPAAAAPAPAAASDEKPAKKEDEEPKEDDKKVSEDEAAAGLGALFG